MTEQPYRALPPRRARLGPDPYELAWKRIRAARARAPTALLSVPLMITVGVMAAIRFAVGSPLAIPFVAAGVCVPYGFLLSGARCPHCQRPFFGLGRRGS